jgi:hypothetical protein
VGHSRRALEDLSEVFVGDSGQKLLLFVVVQLLVEFFAALNSLVFWILDDIPTALIKGSVHISTSSAIGDVELSQSGQFFYDLLELEEFEICGAQIQHP